MLVTSLKTMDGRQFAIEQSLICTACVNTEGVSLRRAQSTLTPTSRCLTTSLTTFARAIAAAFSAQRRSIFGAGHHSQDNGWLVNGNLVVAHPYCLCRHRRCFTSKCATYLDTYKQVFDDIFDDFCSSDRRCF